jgi:YVTN family beta-propeller protein
LLLVANKHSNTLSFINPKTLKVIQTIPTGPNPHEITVTPDQRFAYLSSYVAPGNTISVIDLVKRKQIKQISTGNYSRIHGAAMAPDGRNAYFTAGQSGKVIEVDVNTNLVVRAIETHGITSHMVYVSPDGKTLFTGNLSSGDVSVIDRTSGKLIKLVKTGKGAGGMAFTPDEKFLWVTNETDQTITIIDLATHKAVETFKCEGVIKRIRFTADGKRALVTSWTKEGMLIVLDVATRKEIRRIKVGSHAIGVEISPDGKRAFVGCEDASEAILLPDGTERVKAKPADSDGIHVIDLTKLAVLYVIKTGLGPDPMIMWFPPSKKP